MSGQVQFDGKVPFTDRRTGAQVEVRVWGTFVGQGIDAHEQQPIREWIINALSTSAAAYEGDVQQLAQMGQEWGAYVSQQIAPNLARYFQVQGTLQVHGVQVLGAVGAAPMASPYVAPAAAQPAPMSAAVPAPAPVAKAGAAPSSASLLEAAQAALVQRMDASPDLARQAAMIVLEVVEAHRGPEGKAAPVGAGHGKDPGPAAYGKDPGGVGGYGKDAQPGYGKDPGYSGGYGKDPGYSADPSKGGYGGDPWKK